MTNREIVFVDCDLASIPDLRNRLYRRCVIELAHCCVLLIPRRLALSFFSYQAIKIIRYQRLEITRLEGDDRSANSACMHSLPETRH